MVETTGREIDKEILEVVFVAFMWLMIAPYGSRRLLI